jgi:hypothetical protein
MRHEREVFFTALYRQCAAYSNAYVTLTAIHPDGQHPHPSRHIQIGDMNALRDALEDIDNANRLGWGAFVAIGLRRSGLSRWQRGRAEDVIALPALFVDIDDPSADTLARLRQFRPRPSCIVHSGGGYHAYWWLREPTRELDKARRILHALAGSLGGDHMSIAQSLRLPGTINTKPARNEAVCRTIEFHERHYTLEHFAGLLPDSLPPVRKPLPYEQIADLTSAVVDHLSLHGYIRRGDWLNGPCPYSGRHKHGDRHPSFGFNTRTGYGFCHVCGSMLLKELREILSVSPPRTTYPKKRRRKSCRRLSR